MTDLIGALNSLRLAVNRNTAALSALTQEEMIMDQDVQNLTAVVQQLVGGETALKSDLDALIAAIGSATIPAADRAAIEQAVTDLQTTFGKLEADAAEAVAATPGP